MNWKYSKTITDGEPYFIDNINIWSENWKLTGEKIQIKHPTNNKYYRFDVYEINSNGKIIKFSAGEFSNNVWGIYELENIKPPTKKSIYKMIRFVGVIFIFSSILMFFYSISMFTSRGTYSRFEMKLSEICFMFWLPLLIFGVLILISCGILEKIKSK